MNPRLIGGVFLIEAISLLALFTSQGVDEHSLSVGLRATALVSLLLFVLAFSASALNRMFKKSESGRWLMRNRKSLGLSFALSHFIHLGLIAVRATVFHEVFWAARTPQSLIPGGLTYAFILAMTITSFKGPARWLGRKRWKILHKTGMYVIFALFLSAFASRVASQPYALVPVALLVGALAMRANARLQLMRK